MVAYDSFEMNEYQDLGFPRGQQPYYIYDGFNLL